MLIDTKIHVSVEMYFPPSFRDTLGSTSTCQEFRKVNNLSKRLPVHSLKVEEHLASYSQVSQVPLVGERKHVLEEVTERRSGGIALPETLSSAHEFGVDDRVEDHVVGRDPPQAVLEVILGVSVTEETTVFVIFLFSKIPFNISSDKSHSQTPSKAYRGSL